MGEHNVYFKHWGFIFVRPKAGLLPHGPDRERINCSNTPGPMRNRAGSCGMGKSCCKFLCAIVWVGKVHGATFHDVKVKVVKHAHHTLIQATPIPITPFTSEH